MNQARFSDRAEILKSGMDKTKKVVYWYKLFAIENNWRLQYAKLITQGEYL